MFALFVSAALAIDAPTFTFRQSVAVAGWPAGLLGTTHAEVRTPLYRSDSIVFRDTMISGGVEVLSSPAFVMVGPRVNVAPIDVLDVTLKAMHGWYFDGGLGLMPFSSPSGTLDKTRDLRAAAGEGFAAPSWQFTAEPTLKLKLWRIIAFDSATFDYLLTTRPAGETRPYTYEPLRDVVIAYDDVFIQQFAGLLYEAMDGSEGPILRAGLGLQTRQTLTAGDQSTMLGLLVNTKPGTGRAVPSLTALVFWYVDDLDREGPMPMLAAQAQWELDFPLAMRTAAALTPPPGS